jgi:hypothetical protein
MLARAEHSYAIFHFEKGIPLIVPGTHFADSKALKMQSVSLLYNAQHGDLDVADARGGVWDSGFATTQHHRILITRVKQLKEEDTGEVEPHRSSDPWIGMAKPPRMARGWEHSTK